tara:strand:+ start:113 stop:364 length:252 start_codon:yes stop_codon:yes gene_type:complete
MTPKGNKEIQMRIKRYNDPCIFWKEVSPELKKEEAKNNLSLGLSYHSQTHSNDCLFQAAVFDDSHLLGALCCFKFKTNQNLIV